MLVDCSSPSFLMHDDAEEGLLQSLNFDDDDVIEDAKSNCGINSKSGCCCGHFFFSFGFLVF